MLVRALDYYDYVYSNLDRLAEEFNHARINKEEDPRIMLMRRASPTGSNAPRDMLSRISS